MIYCTADIHGEFERFRRLLELIRFSEEDTPVVLSLIHISEPTRLALISYAVFCLKKKTSVKSLMVLTVIV